MSVRLCIHLCLLYITCPCVCKPLCIFLSGVYTPPLCACLYTLYVSMYVCVWCVCCVCECVTSRSDRGVLSPSGRCCSKARTMQFAMMVVRIIHSNGVQLELRPTSPTWSVHTHIHTSHVRYTAIIHTAQTQPLLSNFCLKFHSVF